MALTNQQSVLNAIPTLYQSRFYLNSASTTSGRFANTSRQSAILIQDSNGVTQIAQPAAASAGGSIKTSADTGYLVINDAPSGQYNYVHSINAVFPSTASGTLYFKDCLWACSGFDGTLTTVQNITGFPTLQRDINSGSDLELWLEVYTNIGATGFNITVNYTKSDNTTTSYTQTLTGGEMNATTPLMLNIPPGGIKSIQSIQLSVSSGTAGNFGLSLYRSICEISQPRGTTFTIPTTRYSYDWTKTGLARIEPGSAVAIFANAVSTTTGAINGSLNLIRV